MFTISPAPSTAVPSPIFPNGVYTISSNARVGQCAPFLNLPTAGGQTQLTAASRAQTLFLHGLLGVGSCAFVLLLGPCNCGLGSMAPCLQGSRTVRSRTTDLAPCCQHCACGAISAALACWHACLAPCRMPVEWQSGTDHIDQLDSAFRPEQAQEHSIKAACKLVCLGCVCRSIPADLSAKCSLPKHIRHHRHSHWQLLVILLLWHFPRHCLLHPGKTPALPPVCSQSVN